MRRQRKQTTKLKKRRNEGFVFEQLPSKRNEKPSSMRNEQQENEGGMEQKRKQCCSINFFAKVPYVLLITVDVPGSQFKMLVDR